MTHKFRLLFPLGLILIYLIGLWICSLLPAEPVRRHIAESIPYLRQAQQEPFYDYYEPFFASHGKLNKAAQIDYVTDGIMLDIAASVDEAHPMRSMLEGRMVVAATPVEGSFTADLEAALGHRPATTFHYDRYWHGYQVVLRPLLEVGNYLDIRRLNLFLLPLLGALVMILLARRKGVFAAGALALSMVAVNAWVVPFCLFFQPVFYIALGACLLMLWRPQIDAATLLLVAGSLTAFTDLLTAPLLTLGLPLAVWLLLHEEELAREKLWSSVRRIVVLCLLWAAGYAVTWLVKGLLAGMVADRGFTEFLRQVGHRLSGGTGAEFDAPVGFFEMRLRAVGYNVLTLCAPYRWPIVAIVAAMIAGWIKWRRRGPVSKSVWLYLLLAVMPPVWYVVVANHSFLHSFMTYRILAISVLGVLLAYRRLIDPRHA